jgi:hypothetical protein
MNVPQFLQEFGVLVVSLFEFFLIEYRLLSLHLLYKLSLSLKLVPLHFKFVQQFRTLSLFLLYFTGGPFELSTQERNVAFMIIVLILFLVDLFETSD